MQTIHIISHTHWDREWYQTFQQFRLKLVHLVDGLLDLLAHDPDYRYFMLDGQTIVLEDYLYMRPEMEDVLRTHIQRGRILIGPWHILPDMFLVSPEAHIRNLLQGTRTARRFGPKMNVGYIPDSFGHPGQIPQLLRGFGIEQAAVWRGVGDQPCEFWWQSPDGSRVLMAYLRDSYSNGAGLPVQTPELFASQLAQAHASLAAHAAAQDVLVMLGTDHMPPSPYTSPAIAEAVRRLPGVQVLHSTLPAYIEAAASQLAAADLPVVRGELRDCSRAPLLPGVLSARTWIKQRNQACQTLLEKWAEPFSVFAAQIGGSQQGQLANPAPILRQAWRLLMENHPHDSICGCSIDQVHDEMKPRFDQVAQIGEEITRQSLQAITTQIDTQAEGALGAVVVFNPGDVARRDLAEVELNLPEDVPAFEIVDDDGTVCPHASLGSHEQVFANILLKKDDLFEMVGNIHEGRVAGMSILRISISRSGNTAAVEAVVDEHAPPNLAAWQQAEREIAALRSDALTTHIHVLARTPRASRVRFAASAPAHGWRTFWVRAAGAPPVPAEGRVHPLLKPLLPLGMRLASSPLGIRLLARLAPADEFKPPFVIENEFFQVTADPQDGTLTVIDRRSGTVYTGLNRFVDGGDAGDEYNYAPPAQDGLVTARLDSVRVFRHALPSSLEIRLTLRLPWRLAPDRQSRSTAMVDIPITTRVHLVPGEPRIDLRTEIENRAEDHRLRVHFPAPFKVSGADYDGHFEVVRRPLGLPAKGEGWVESPRPEAPQRAFTDLSDGERGLMVANRGLPEVEVLATAAGSELALTLLRCVGWLSRDDLPVRLGHAGPGMAAPGAQMPGSWVFEYALIPHTGGWQTAFQQAYAFETPLRAMASGLHTGVLPASGSFITHAPPEFAISALKAAEDGSGWVVRGCNPTGEPLAVQLSPHLPYAAAWRVNLAEERLAPLARGEDGTMRFTVRGCEVVTVRFDP